MSEVKDLLLIDLNEEKKDKNKKTDKIEMKRTSTEKEIIDEDTLSDTFEMDEVEDENIDEEKIRKYFKYENGRVKYINSKKEGLSLKDIKDEINIEKKRIDKKGLASKALVVVIIITFVFTYMYYFSGEKDIEDNSQDIVMNSNQSKDNNLPLSQDIKDEIIEENKEDELQLLDLIQKLKKKNSKELSKLNDYLDMKSNKVSTESLIKTSKREKEELYSILYLNKEHIKEDAYREAEEIFIRSIAMSEELLKLFKENGRKTDFESLIEGYK